MSDEPTDQADQLSDELAKKYDPERLLLGETYVMELDRLTTYVVPDGLQRCMNLVFLHAPFVAA